MKKNIYNTKGLPNGKNSLSSRAGFVQKSYYNAYLKPIEQQIGDNLLDLIYDYENYLKYDFNNNIVNISETKLKNIDTDIYVVNFVADAFEDLKKLCKNSKHISDEKLKNISPKKGWESLHQNYHKHVTEIYNDFVKYLTNFKKDKKILNFEDFILYFVKYLDQVVYKVPFLKSSYLISKDYSLSNTGFIIEIDDIKKDKDKDKIEKYFDTYSFSEFVKLCNKTGFAIDKNCPWRLIFKVYSQEAEKYLFKYKITAQNFSDEYFYKTKEFDLDNLKNYMIIFYNTFIEKNPTSNNPKIITYNEQKIIINNLFDRIQIDKNTIKTKYDDNFWFQIYSHISFVENKLDLSNQKYKNVLNNLNITFKKNGKFIAIKQLENLILNSKKTITKTEYNFVLPPPA